MIFDEYFQTLATSMIGTTESVTNSKVTSNPEADPMRNQYPGRNPLSFAEKSGMANIAR
jgi:hypothetical protein